METATRLLPWFLNLRLIEPATSLASMRDSGAVLRVGTTLNPFTQPTLTRRLPTAVRLMVTCSRPVTIPLKLMILLVARSNFLRITVTARMWCRVLRNLPPILLDPAP